MDKPGKTGALMPVEDALRQLLDMAEAAPIREPHVVPLADCDGRVLAQDLIQCSVRLQYRTAMLAAVLIPSSSASYTSASRPHGQKLQFKHTSRREARRTQPNFTKSPWNSCGNQEKHCCATLTDP